MLIQQQSDTLRLKREQGYKKDPITVNVKELQN